ncbi:MAG: hypothetical protein AAF799_07595 [Myxococcota bacterium]
MPFPLPMAPSALATWSALPLSLLVYLLLLYDARRKDSPTADDTQLGLKTVAAVLTVVATFMFALGLQDLLHTLLTFDEFWDRFKVSFPSVLIGGGFAVGGALVLFPRTNAEEYPKAKRLAAGVIAIVGAVSLLPALAGFISTVLDWPSWSAVAAALSSALVSSILFVLGFGVLGKLSGMKMPEPKAKPPQASPPQGGQPFAGQQPAQPQAPAGHVAPGQPAAPQGYPGQPAAGYPGQPAAPQGFAQPQPGQPPAPGQPPGQGWPQG